jgi:hypothetical protein
MRLNRLPLPASLKKKKPEWVTASALRYKIETFKGDETRQVYQTLLIIAIRCSVSCA